MVMAHPSPQQVGREFVRQYYTVLHEAPEVLHRFYSSGSTFVHGGVDRPGHHVEEPVVGQLEIDKKIRSLAFKDCHTKIRQVDAQATIGSGVVVQVTGELSNNGEPMRRFMQTFVLAPQTPKKFYVHNDIFRYQDEVYHDLSDTEEEVHVQAQPPSSQPTPASQTVSTSSGVDLKASNFYQSGSTESGDGENIEHHLHHEHASNASTSSQTSSSSSSSATPASNPPVTNAVEHHEDEKQPTVVSQSIPTSEPDRKQPTGSDPIAPKENGPSSDVKSSWAHIIQHKTDGKSADVTSAAPTVTQPAPQPAQTQSQTSYSTNSLPRNNKENRPSGSFKQNGGGFNNGKPSTGSANQTPKQRNTNSFSNNTNTVAAPQTAPAASSTTAATQARQNGSEDDADDKKFAASTRYPDTHQVFVGNLSQELSDAELRTFFGQYGRVVEVRINSNTKQQSGRRLPNYGFVVFDDSRAVENLLSSTKSNNLTLKNERGEFRLNIEEKRARQARQSSGFGGNKPASRSTRSTSNGSGGGGSGAHMNGKKPPYRGDSNAVNDDAGIKRGGGGGQPAAANNAHPRRF